MGISVYIGWGEPGNHSHDEQEAEKVYFDKSQNPFIRKSLSKLGMQYWMIPS